MAVSRMSQPETPDTKQRPRVFRALGLADPPIRVQVDGRELQLQKLIKHDSWAATAIYRAINEINGGPSQVVCKFNRIEPIFLFPMKWLGRWLASRESGMYEQLNDVPRISKGYRDVLCDGKRLPHAAAHEFIEGHPLSWQDRVERTFFEQLEETIAAIHKRGVAYVDLNKWENIIVDQTGKPWLIDFQISVRLPRVWPLSMILRILQQSDCYHLSKHASRIRPDLFPEHLMFRPWWIQLHRKIATPLRALRRRLLVVAGVRSGSGKPQSEAFVEEGLRETDGGSTAIARLYQLLRSEAYVKSVLAMPRAPGQCSPQDQSSLFARSLFVDLIGRPPGNDLEQGLVDRLEGYTRHDQVIWLVKSRLFQMVSKGWDDQFIERKIVELRERVQQNASGSLAVG
jgi:hypothetical protein